MRALVLAAGEGSRLGKLTKQKPKALVRVAGVPLLGRVLRGLKEAGIRDVWIVIGYMAATIRREIGEDYAGLKIHYIHAYEWEKGNLHSFLAARDFLKTKFLLCMCDHISDTRIVKRLVNINPESALVLTIDRSGYSPDDTKVLEQNDVILDIGKTINKSNCVDTGFFLCSPKIFEYADRAAQKGASELADGVRVAALSRDAGVTDVSGYYWVDIDTKRDLERGKRLLVKHAQKGRGASDFVAHYFNRPMENAIIYRISDRRITPNQLTIATNALAYLITALFLTGHLLVGSILTFAVGVMDGLDGKLARVRMRSTRLGLMEHSFDMLFEFSWLIALALFLFTSSESALPLVLCLFSILFIAFYRHCYDIFSRAMNTSLDNYGSFERAFRRVAGRRNLYNVHILIGVLLGVPLYSLMSILGHSVLTAVVYAWMAGKHLHFADKRGV